MGTAEERVNAGAAWLDENVPGWRDKVNPRTLDMRRSDGCVLSQATGLDYWKAVDKFRLSDEQGQDLGFDVQADHHYPSLTSAWRELLAARYRPGKKVRRLVAELAAGVPGAQRAGFFAATLLLIQADMPAWDQETAETWLIEAVDDIVAWRY